MAINQGAVQVTVTINGSSITIDKKNFVNLRIKRFIGDSANSFTLEAFDETAYALENLLMQKKNFAPISVQYCSAQNMNNKITFSGTCFNYQISFVGKGTLISITGIFSGGDLESTKYWFEKANVEWVDAEPRFIDGEWTVDGYRTSDEAYANYLTNEDVCAILKFGDDAVVASGIANSSSSSEVAKVMRINVSSYAATSNSTFENMNLSTYCTELAGRVRASCESRNISVFYPITMAIMMQESGGNYHTTPDVFQCSKSLGKPPDSITLEESIKQGPKYFSECLIAAAHNIEIALQAYNFDIGFAYWAVKSHPGQKFNKSWAIDWKKLNRKDDSYGDNDYVEHVKRYYRVKEDVVEESIETESENNGLTSNSNISEVRVDGDKSETPTVFFNPSRIFKRIMKTYRGDYSNNKELYDYFKIGKVEDTQWVSGLDVCQTNETAAEYINRVLVKNSMTVNSDKKGNSNYGEDYLLQSTGYKYYVDSRGHNFEHIDFDANVSKAPTITYGSRDSIIISFSTGSIGAIAMTGNMYDENTGLLNIDEATLNDISGTVFTIGGENVLGADTNQEQAEVTKEYKKWRNFQTSPNKLISSSSSTSFTGVVTDTWYNLKAFTTTAEMTVWGESGVKLTPGSFVNIIIYGNGMQHYSSGCYFITSMEDNISAEGYTQTCRMIKNLGNIKARESTGAVTSSLKSEAEVASALASASTFGSSITTMSAASNITSAASAALNSAMNRKAFTRSNRENILNDGGGGR